ncbi:MAG: sigma-70 family RNA polymerase sigma factor, partial [Planctomycetales bacterium]
MAANNSAIHRYELRDPDVRLMLEVRDDNAAAFEELVARYQSRLIGVLEHLVSDRDQAEDLAQETFLRVYRARKNYHPTAKFSTWLFTIANNAALSALRLKSRRREIHLDSGDGSPTGAARMDDVFQVSSGQIPARQMDKAEMRDVVRASLSILNDRQRMALLLNKFE